MRDVVDRMYVVARTCARPTGGTLAAQPDKGEDDDPVHGRAREGRRADCRGDDIARALVNLTRPGSGPPVTQAAEVALESIQVVEGLGLGRRKGVWCRCDAAEALLLLGRTADASRLMREAMDLAPAGIDAVRTDLTWGKVLLRQGRLDEARASLELARSAGGRLLDGQLVGPLYASLVEVATWQHDHAAASAWAAEGTSRLLPDEDAAFCVQLFAAAAAACAESAVTGRGRPRGDDAAGALAGWVRRCDDALARTPARTPAAAAQAAAARCEQARAEGRDKPAEWAAVAALHDGLSDPYGAGYARVRAAESLLRHGSARPQAQQRLAEARNAAQRAGASHVLMLWSARCWPWSWADTPTARSGACCSSATAPSGGTSPTCSRSWPPGTAPS
jgi:hypothetical protein